MKMMRYTTARMIAFAVALLCCLAGFAQENADADLRDKFINYQRQSMQEKLFAHTDKTFYLAGEVIWFKVYVTDASFDRPLDLSRVAYVELLSEEQKPVLQASIGLQQGSGNGSFIIPSSLPSGNYVLRSYTSRMKNFSTDFYFHQTISIVNTLKAPVAPAEPVAPLYRAHFFPEGGNLVNGEASVVAFTVNDQYGRPAAASGLIVIGTDTISQLQTLQHGAGRFTLTPEKGKIYQAIIRTADTTIKESLPPAFDDGYVMTLKDDGAKNQLVVTVSSTNRFNNTPVYLFVHNRQMVKEAQRATIENNHASFSFSKDKLVDGIAHITIFNGARQPVCERLYCKRPGQGLQVAFQSNSAQYQPRGKVDIGLQVSAAHQPIVADLSAAVFMVDSLQAPNYRDIRAWLLLQSDLPGNFDDAAAYLADSSASAALALDNLMLTKGWRRFSWDSVLAGKAPMFDYITETEGPVINGRVTDKKTGLPKGNVLTTLTIPGESFEMRTAISKSDGSIRFNVNNFYSGNDIILQAANAADTSMNIRISSPFSNQFAATKPLPLLVTPRYKEQLLYRSISAQADNAYLIDKKRESFITPVVDTNVFYGKSEKQYYLDDYTRFITMEEVMKEFIVDVRVRKQAGGYQFRVVNAAYKSFFDQDPLVLIDGVPVTNLNKIMAFDPLKIKRIDVATHKHFLGPLISEGIISYKTYNGDLGGYELDPQAIVLEYDGLQRQREFYSPMYETTVQKESRVPDLRNVLYWQPTLNTGSDGKQRLSFFTSDLTGRFALVVQGISIDGAAGSSMLLFDVK